MRKLPLSLLIALLALFAFAAPASALSLPSIPAGASEAPAADEVEADDEADASEAESGEEEGCWAVAEEDFEACLDAEEEREAAEEEECLLEDATARVAANRANNTVRLTIHYEALAPAAVSIKAKLRGSKGQLRLGASHARFRLAGVFHDSFGLSEKRMEKALAAREFAIDLHALNTPGHCRLHLTAHRGGASKRLWS
ncbi:MAG TPA: hypothetical protein VD741_09600 [Solirubrobacterales bacterium]|nr:hypothetical protein [Solirubrobacterales bacterium]